MAFGGVLAIAVGVAMLVALPGAAMIGYMVSTR